nr:hypothetical protein [uncultured Clostridium sp.]
MWQCPKCGREFKNQDQNHFCSETPDTIGAYIEAQAKEVQPLLHQVRDTIRTALPDAEERISWRMPYDRQLPLDLIAEIAKWCYESLC